MAELNFNASDVPPQDKGEDTTYELNPVDHDSYVEACKQRKQIIADAKNEWRKAIQEIHTAKANAMSKRLAMDAAIALPVPVAPYQKLLAAGVPINAPDGE